MENVASATVPWYRRFSRWRQTSHGEAVAAEEALFGLCRTPVQTTDVPIGTGRQDYVHTIHARNPVAGGPTLVSVPGYAAGSGHEFRVVDGFASAFRFYLVDLLGTGLSGRPKFRAKNTEDAISFFVESLEAWRSKLGIERMLLMGHSMGGYLSACYALKYPEHVEHLLLVSPVGVGRTQPWRGGNRLPSAWTLRGQAIRLARLGWDANLTPGVIVRGLGPFGPGLVGKYVRARFHQGLAMSPEEVARFHDYLYHILAARGSGEFALRHILAPFAHPRHALEDRCADLRVPVTFFYGDVDWMDPNAGRRMAKELLVRRGSLAPLDGEVVTTPQAGHYLFMDNPSTFLRQVAEATAPYLSSEARQRLLLAAENAGEPLGEPFTPGEELEEQVERDPSQANATAA